VSAAGSPKGQLRRWGRRDAYRRAVRVWLPTATSAVLKAAFPEPSTATPDAQTVALSVNVTVPAGTPAPEATFAVNVTYCPNVEGLGEELSEVVAVQRSPSQAGGRRSGPAA